MSYLYSLLGITIWVTMVALSSNALITHENNLLSAEVEQKIEIISNEQKNPTTPIGGGTKEVPDVINRAKVTSVEAPLGIQKKKESTSRRDQNFEDEDGEDD